MIRTTAAATTTSRSERARTRFGRGVFLLASALAFSAPSCAEKTAPAEDAAAPLVELPPVPEPAGLAATFALSKPGETWGKLRDLGGGPARLLPQSFGLLVSTLLGLPPALAEAIDPDVMMTGAVVADDQGKTQAAVAIHVRSGRELVAKLSAGADAPYGKKDDPASGLMVLEPKPGKAPTGVALGISGNYLVAARYAADLVQVGPYAARTLSKQPAPKSPLLVEVKKRALEGPLAKALREGWAKKKAELQKLDLDNRQKHGGKTPDFGDPAAALESLGGVVESIAAVLASSRGGRLGVEPFADHLQADLELDAEPSGPAHDMIEVQVVGDAAPIAALPSSTPIAVLSRTGEGARKNSAKSMEAGFANLFADRLSTADRDKLKGVLDKLAEGRGDFETYGVLLEGGKGGVVYRAQVKDPKAFDAGAKDLFKLLSIKAFAEPLRQFAGEFSVKQSTAAVPGVPGTTQRTVLAVQPSAMRTATDKTGKLSKEGQNLEVLWVHKDGHALGAASPDAVPVLAALVASEADPKTTHQGDAKVAAALARVRDASFVVMVQPQRLSVGADSLNPSAPVVVSFGKRESTLALRVDADPGALETLLKSFALSR